jgi:hypothetical protein
MIARDLCPGMRFYFVDELVGALRLRVFVARSVSTREPRPPVSYYDRQPLEAITTIACDAQVFNVPASTQVEIAR